VNTIISKGVTATSIYETEKDVLVMKGLLLFNQAGPLPTTDEKQLGRPRKGKAPPKLTPDWADRQGRIL